MDGGAVEKERDLGEIMLTVRRGEGTSKRGWVYIAQIIGINELIVVRNNHGVLVLLNNDL
jgi:hypothetical protein